MLSRILAASVAVTLAGTTLAQVDAVRINEPEKRAIDEVEKKDKLFDLMVGDKAPPLVVDTWVKGEPITGFEKGRVYVVEFWATWCGPCIRAMPHLSELQAKYEDKGVRIIGMTSRDQRNTLDAVKQMVADKGDGMAYSVAWDTDRQTNTRYMRAAGQGGIPCSYIVDKQGRIAYIGHPMSMDAPLAAVVAGTHDIKKAATEYETRRRLEKQVNALRSKAYQASRANDWDGAIAAYDELIALDPSLASYKVDRAMVLLTGAKQYDAAYASLRPLVAKDFASSPSVLNRIAWTILDEKGIEHRDLELAMDAAVKANDLTKGEDPAILDTLARAHYETGDLKQAIKVQSKAVDAAGGSMKTQLQEVLDKYLEEQG